MRGAVVPVVTIGLGFGAIYGGFHYAIDVVAGAALGVSTAFAGLWLVGARRVQANAIAPTYPPSER